MVESNLGASHIFPGGREKTTNSSKRKQKKHGVKSSTAKNWDFWYVRILSKKSIGQNDTDDQGFVTSACWLVSSFEKCGVVFGARGEKL